MKKTKNTAVIVTPELLHLQRLRRADNYYTDHASAHNNGTVHSFAIDFSSFRDE
jgi:hypothetical protein